MLQKRVNPHTYPGSVAPAVSLANIIPARAPVPERIVPHGAGDLSNGGPLLTPEAAGAVGRLLGHVYRGDVASIITRKAGL